MTEKTEQYFEYIINYLQQMEGGKQEAPKNAGETSLGKNVLAIQENKAYYIDEWNTPIKVDAGNIAATTNISNIFDTSITNVLGDIFPEVFGYIFGKSGKGNPYYDQARKSINDNLKKEEGPTGRIFYTDNDDVERVIDLFGQVPNIPDWCYGGRSGDGEGIVPEGNRRYDGGFGIPEKIEIEIKGIPTETKKTVNVNTPTDYKLNVSGKIGIEHSGNVGFNHKGGIELGGMVTTASQKDIEDKEYMNLLVAQTKLTEQQEKFGDILKNEYDGLNSSLSDMVATGELEQAKLGVFQNIDYKKPEQVTNALKDIIEIDDAYKSFNQENIGQMKKVGEIAGYCTEIGTNLYNLGNEIKNFESSMTFGQPNFGKYETYIRKYESIFKKIRGE